MKILAPYRRLGPQAGKTSLRTKLYPNGEVAIWKEKTYKPRPLRRAPDADRVDRTMCSWRLYLDNPWLWFTVTVALGSSPHPNFDSLLTKVSSPNEGEPCVITRYGRNGITSYGARRVRNGCHVVENAFPKRSTVFSTCTVPAMPVEDMARLHNRWNHVVETFRRKLTRRLKDKNLSGESVTVSEIQTKRYENTGLPVLHIHTVFNGRDKSGKPAITIKEHDCMWRDALTAGVCGPVPKVDSACNLQWVKKSAEGYLGKYMSKGTKTVRELCEAGFEGWLPKQWWSMTRSLGQRIDKQTRRIDEFGEWLNDIAEVEGVGVWLWHRTVELEMKSGDKITVARYGRLTKRQTAEFLNLYPKPDG